MIDTEYSLIVAFPDHSQSFTLGFEAGMAWARMERRESFAMLAHVENQEVLFRMAQSCGHTMAWRPCPSPHDQWADADFDWSPNRLRVIQGGLQA